MATAQLSPLSVLIAAQVPRRREGGGATIAYNLGRGLEQRGHSVTYLFEEDLFGQDEISRRFRAISFARRLDRHISRNRNKYSVVNIHAPAGLVYGIHRHWLGSRDLPPYVMTLHGLEERRIYVQSREVEKGRAWNFILRNRLWHRFYTLPIYRWAIRTVDGAHTYSRDVWNILQLKYNLDSDRVVYIPNGVEPRFFFRATTNRSIL